MSDAAQRKETKVGYRNTMLDNARKLRGIYFIDPTDEELVQVLFFQKMPLRMIWRPPRPDNVWPDMWKQVSDAAKKESETKMGYRRNQSSTMPDNWEEYSSLN